jgi:tetrahydromethanopterin S-methyltransferase subunit H
MSEIIYESSRIEGGIEAFAEVLKNDRGKPEIGQVSVPSPDAARRYARFVESILDAQCLDEEAEELLAAA